MSNAIRVAVRVRPLGKKELELREADCTTVVPPRTLLLGPPGDGQKQFSVDRVFSSEEGQAAVYDDAVAPMVKQFTEGYNATCFAYGQTGTGKTFTMGTAGGSCVFGDGDMPDAAGVIPRVARDVFAHVRQCAETGSRRCAVKASFLEIYRGEVNDLLAASAGVASSSSSSSAPVKGGLAVREDASGAVLVQGLSTEEVCDEASLVAVMKRGGGARATASTDMNEGSSRSHAVLSLYLEQTTGAASAGEAAGTVRRSKLHLVDLAGSERQRRTGAEGARLREGIAINGGLLALGNVINALAFNAEALERARKEPAGDGGRKKGAGRAAGKAAAQGGAAAAAPTAGAGRGERRVRLRHVPYRDSKLTRLLRDSLGGDCLTSMIACVGPSDASLDETTTTLRYACRARAVRNSALLHAEADPTAARVSELQEQVRRLTAALGRTQGGAGADGAGADGGAGAAVEEAEALAALRRRVEVLDSERAALRHRAAALEREAADAADRAAAAETAVDVWRWRHDVAAAAAASAGTDGNDDGDDDDEADDGGETKSAGGGASEPPTVLAELRARVRELEGLTGRSAAGGAASAVAGDDGWQAMLPADDEILEAFGEVAEQHEVRQRRMRDEMQALGEALRSKQRLLEAAAGADGGLAAAVAGGGAGAEELEQRVSDLEADKADLQARLRRAEKEKPADDGSARAAAAAGAGQLRAQLEERQKQLAELR